MISDSTILRRKASSPSMPARVLVAAMLMGAFSAAGLYAQTEADAKRAQEALEQAQDKKTAAQPAAGPAAPAGPQTDPAKLKWSGSVTGGFQFSRGQTNADGVSVLGDAQYAGINRGYRFEGMFLYATVRVPIAPGQTQDFTAQDRRNGYFTFFQKIKGPVFFVNRASLEHDVVRDIKFRAMDMSGIGLRLAASQKLQAFVAPGVGFAYENKPGIRDGAVFSLGVFQRATWHINRIWTVDQWFQYRSNPNNTHDYSMDGFAGLTGLIYTTKLGFSVGYVYSYEGLVGVYGGSVVPLPTYHVLSQATIGLKFTL